MKNTKEKGYFPLTGTLKAITSVVSLSALFFSYTLSFVLCLALWGLYDMERWMNTMELKGLTAAGLRIGIIYLIGLVIYLGISAAIYMKKYEYASRGTKVYLAKLKRLDKRYEGNTRPLKRTKGGRTS
uniref:hypothetical protein n=1 Tax=Clostridium sp. NkU-1 TaxID=1095009 RepID=UPI0032601703